MLSIKKTFLKESNKIVVKIYFSLSQAIPGLLLRAVKSI